MKFIAIIALFAAVGCSGPQTTFYSPWWSGLPYKGYPSEVAIKLAPSIEPYRAYLFEGAAAWGAFGVTFTVDEKELRTVRCADNPDTFNALGHTDGTGIQLLCSFLDGSAGPSFERRKVDVFAHEFGHYLGLAHVVDPNAIMNAQVPDTEAFTQSDLDEFKSVN